MSPETALTQVNVEDMQDDFNPDNSARTCQKIENITFFRHHEWRKKAKRARRQRIRQEAAAARDLHLHLTQQEYEVWLKEQEALEQFEYEHILKSNNEESEKWCKAVQQADEMWSRMQREKDRLRIAELEQETKRQLEWEQEKEKRRKEQERLKEIEEENKRKHEMFMTQLEQFLAGDSREPPPELLIARETRPECDPCPFFTKTSCCRFGDQCSRNHKYPGISCVLLATNFFAHFGLDNASFSEYDTDVMLEYEDSDTYKVFKDFFYDVVPEFEKFGRVTQFKVCHNFEKHLRGNTYVEFAEVRCAVAAYRALHSRWYGGKQLSLQFCLISSWKNAICGLQPKKRCPKGRSCNFLHVFKNPGNKCNSYESESREHSNQSQRSQSWRWSVSPEVEITERSWERFSRSRSSRHSTPRERHRRRSRSTHRKRRKSKSRSRSKERRRSKSRERRKHRRKGRENRENCVKSSGKENIQNSHFDRNSSERKSNVT